MALLALPMQAQAAFPGQNGKLAFRDSPSQGSSLFSIEPDGTGLTPLGSGFDPAWSPDGSRLAFADGGEVFVMNADGTGRTPLTTDPLGDSGPAWSPDGSAMVFQRTAPDDGTCVTQHDLFKMNATGESGGVTQLTYDYADEYSAKWSPDGRVIAFIRHLIIDTDPEVCDVIPFGPELFVMNSDGTGARRITEQAINDFDWSPDGSKIVYSQSGDLWTVRPDGTENARLTSTNSGPASVEQDPVWSPDGTKIAFQSGSNIWVTNADGTGVADLVVDTSSTFTKPDWQPLPVNGASPYIRPKTATKVRLGLVPAAKPCTSPNREHGPPLASGACTPVERSTYLSVGIGDGNPAFARSVGFMRMRVLAGTPGPPDDSDVRIRLALTHVMRTGDLSEYTGELRGELTVRRTDREPGLVSSTSMDFPFGFTVPCTPTPASDLDASSCITTTSVHAVIPGAIKDGHRTIWGLDALRVYDGGPDEDADTEADNALFMTQGVFVP